MGSQDSGGEEWHLPEALPLGLPGQPWVRPARRVANLLPVDSSAVKMAQIGDSNPVQRHLKTSAGEK